MSWLRTTALLTEHFKLVTRDQRGQLWALFTRREAEAGVWLPCLLKEGREPVPYPIRGHTWLWRRSLSCKVCVLLKAQWCLANFCSAEKEGAQVNIFHQMNSSWALSRDTEGVNLILSNGPPQATIIPWPPTPWSITLEVFCHLTENFTEHLAHDPYLTSLHTKAPQN